MISGGVASSDDAAKRCYENDNGFRDAIEEFGADCDSDACAFRHDGQSVYSGKDDS